MTKIKKRKLASLKTPKVVNLKVEGSKIINSPNKKRGKYTLEELLSKVTPENLHGEIDFGPPVGKEIL